MTSAATSSASEEASAEKGPRFEIGFDVVDGFLVARNLGMLGSVISATVSTFLNLFPPAPVRAASD